MVITPKQSGVAKDKNLWYLHYSFCSGRKVMAKACDEVSHFWFCVAEIVRDDILCKK